MQILKPKYILAVLLLVLPLHQRISGYLALLVSLMVCGGVIGLIYRYEPLGGVIWSQVAAGLYQWRNIRLEFTQAMTKATMAAGM